METIIAFSNFNEKKLSIFDNNCKIVLCGGISFFQINNENSFEYLKRIKKERKHNFVMLFSPDDVYLLIHILDLFKFITFSKDILKKANCKLEKVPDPINILDFKEEYGNIIKKNIINSIIDGSDVELSDKRKNFLFSVVSKLESFNFYNLETVIYLMKNSNIIHEANNFIFSSENGHIGYKSLKELKTLYKTETEAYISSYSKFLKRYSRKHKKISFAKLDKCYIVGDNDKRLDRPYFRSDQNALYIGTTTSNYYLENKKLKFYTNYDSFSYVIVTDVVTVCCRDCKNDYHEYILNLDEDNTYEIEEKRYRKQSISTKGYAIKVSENHVAIPIKTEKTFIAANKNDVEKKDLYKEIEKEEIITKPILKSKYCQILEEDDISIESGSTQRISDIIDEDDRSIESGKTQKLCDIIENRSVSSRKSVNFHQKTRCRSDSSDSSDIEQFVQNLKGL